MANLKDVIYISNEDYTTLITNGTVTISGVTLTYDDNTVYITPEELATASNDGLMSSSDKVALDATVDIIDTTLLPIAEGNYTSNNNLTTLSYKKISVVSLSANRTFTLETTPADSYPEYKLFVTNSHSTDSIYLTFTGITNIMTNDINLSVTTNSIALPAGESLEINIQNNKLMAFN